ncbi:LysR family transcriptional regulator [Rhodococcus ruber]|uniref:LysR family transcriptional regulator n=1 Tax=Rhodococcus ruber TaxID=1830 RepID=UPI00315D50A6
MDLNFLRLLDALLTEKSVSRAAQKVGLSQPTMSGALAKLRRYFDDELLVRTGNNYLPSPLAQDLQPLVASALAAAQRVFDIARFDPRVSEREFTLATTDYGIATLVPEIVRVMSDSAPGTRLRVIPPESKFFEVPEVALRTVDAMLAPRGVVRGFHHLDLVSDEWVCVMSRDHPLAGTNFTLADLLRYPWVATTPRLPTAPTLALELLGAEPSTKVTVESFYTVPSLVVGSDRVAVLQRELVRRSAHAGELVISPPPFPVPSLVQALWWHPGFDDDAGHRWWRSCVQEGADHAIKQRRRT